MFRFYKLFNALFIAVNLHWFKMKDLGEIDIEKQRDLISRDHVTLQ